MQRLQGWVRYAAEITGRAGQGGVAGTERQQHILDEDEEDFIYARIAVHSDDEDAGHHSRPPRQRKPRVSAPGRAHPHSATAPSSPASEQHHHQQQQQQQTPALELGQQRFHSDGELTRLDYTCQHQRFSSHTDPGSRQSSLFRIESGDGPGWTADWAEFGESHSTADLGNPHQQQHSQQVQQPHDVQQEAAAAAAVAAGTSSSCSASKLAGSSGSRAASAKEAEAAALAELDPAAGFEADAESGGASGQPSRSSSGVQADDFDYSGDIPDHDHSQKRQELIIYAIPLSRGKVIFLPVCPWRAEPDRPTGWKKAVAGHVDKVQGEASGIWQKMATAEHGTIVNRVYKLGKRVLDSISPEERLMRGVPKNISKVIIHHPSQVSPDTIMEQMSTMTKSYGIKAVGRAAAATVMLPLAVGVDLIILPGPQVLTYYTMWELYRNTNGALGTTRMTKFITQGGSSENIRVNYTQDSRLDKYYDMANDCPEGVLTEDEIDGLVTDLREPDLLEALLSLRNKVLHEAGRRTSRGGDEYVALPPTDPAAAPAGFGSTASIGRVVGSGSTAR